jgi:Ran GTPase-activating protein (RanGAP) involved in mRNA processing and transport
MNEANGEPVAGVGTGSGEGTRTDNSSPSQRDVVIRLFMNNDNPTVDLSHIDMSSGNIFKLCQCLKNSKLSGKKSEINLSLCNIEEKRFSLLFEAFSTLTQEFSLILNFNKLSVIALQEVKRIFSDLVKLKFFSLDGTLLGDNGVAELVSHLPMTKTLCHLSLESNRLNLEGIAAIAKVLPTTASLRLLNLRGNNLSDERSVQVLCAAIGQSQIESINLEMTNIQPLAVRHISSLLSQSRSLTSLDLSSNHLHAPGMRFLADGLRDNLTLVSLRLAGCFIGVSGLTSLTAGLVDNDTLRSLDLSRIHSAEEAFGEEGAKAIADMLTLNRGITTLK